VKAFRGAHKFGLALSAALFALAAPAVSDAACRARPDGACLHPGAACRPPSHGVCRNVARPTPFRHRSICLCGTPGKPILLP
jgi:hypothetical protein